jgi:hypothetical protein
MYFCAHTQDSSLGTKIKFAQKKTLKTIKVRAKKFCYLNIFMKHWKFIELTIN